MSTWKRLTRRSAPEVFDRIIKMPKDEQKVILEAFNEALNDLRDQDAFGTEGQCDPRGDPRS